MGGGAIPFRVPGGRIRTLAADARRTLRFGIRFHVVARDTNGQAWAAAERLLTGIDPDHIARAQAHTGPHLDAVHRPRLLEPAVTVTVAERVFEHRRLRHLTREVVLDTAESAGLGYSGAGSERSADGAVGTPGTWGLPSLSTVVLPG